jgi:hypothetical protein
LADFGQNLILLESLSRHFEHNVVQLLIMQFLEIGQTLHTFFEHVQSRILILVNSCFKRLLESGHFLYNHFEILDVKSSQVAVLTSCYLSSTFALVKEGNFSEVSVLVQSS